MTLGRAVFLDRDGVLNKAIVRQGKPYSPTILSDFEILPGAAEACQSLRAAGYLLVVVTNQPDVARGKQRHEIVESFHQVLQAHVLVDDLRVCFHDDQDACVCRKPAPGLLLQAAVDRQIDLSASFMVGDRWKDIEAGRRAGCRTVLIDCGYSEGREIRPDYRARSLMEAADWILRQTLRSVDERGT